ncbi:hypothetical protein HZA73_09665 [candidate division TA06 bacterium]|nr:hypothetical protein [candidate division TA06 bacterium]
MKNTNRHILILTWLFLICTSAAFAQSPDSSSSKLGGFEKGLSKRDSTSGQERSPDTDECNEGESFWGELVFFIPKIILKACVAGYCSLPGPNYGPYPYYSVSSFTAMMDCQPAAYFTVNTGYQHTYRDIPTAVTGFDLYAGSFVLGASYDQYRERLSGGGLYQFHNTSIKLGLRKALGEYVIWRNHLGWRWLKGAYGQSAALIGTEWKIFTDNRGAITLGYDYNYFPETGTSYHDCGAYYSYFVKRIELKFGYHAAMIYRGPSLHGPYAGVNWNF